MKAVILLALAIAVSASSVVELREKFLAFQQQYNRAYKTQDEFEHRFAIFQENLKKAEKLQAMNPLARFGVTQFSDLSEDEFAERYLMKNLDLSTYVRPPVKTDFSPKPNPRFSCNPDPTNFDWNSCNVITPVYNQGQCGSCWAFSATETIESYYAIAGYPLTGLSMEQIVSCDTNGNDQGCNGGFPTGAYQYVEEAGGLDSYADYPYSAGEGEAGSCNFNAAEAVATVTSYQSIDGETGLYQQTSSSSGGPVSVCVDASSWSSYQGGILTSCGNSVDHCVQLTGYANYGQSNAYWIVRNSWDVTWGENGYIWIAIGQDLCSIGDYATVVVATKASGGNQTNF
jgi:cathepsin F/cysteine peptidase B